MRHSATWLRNHRFALCQMLLCMVTSVALGYPGVTGTLEGTVRDKASKQPLPGVNVVIVQTGQGAATDATGFYRITNVRAGEYEVRITIMGFRSYTAQAVRILPDLRTKLNAELEESMVEMPPIVVGAERPVLQRDITGTAVEVQSTTVSKLPIDTFKDVVGLQAGTTLEGNVRGGKVSEVNYLVDGMPLQDLIGGGVAADVPRAAIAQMTVKTGGFDSEYGNALSGIVNVVTRSGGNDFRFSVRGDKDNLFGGKEVSKANEVEAWASGPIKRDKLFYFSAVDYSATDTRWWQDFEHFFDSPIQRDVSGFGKLEYHFKPEMSLSTQAIYSHSQWRDYEFSWRFNLDGLPPRQRDFTRLAANWSHTLSKRSFYTVNASFSELKSRINDNQPVALSILPYEYDFFLQYIISGQREWWGASTQRLYSIRGDYTTQLSKQSTLRAGIEVNQFDVQSDVAKLEPQTTYFGKPIIDKPLLNFASSYDYHPRSGSVFVQSKFDFSDDGAVASIGFRYDFLDPRAARPAVELVPTSPDEYTQQLKGFVPASIKSVYGPRLGLAMPMSEKTFFFVNFGLYHQFPLFDYLYQGIDNVKLRNGVSVLVGNPDLLPERTSAWEMSFRYALDNRTLLSVTYFHKETRNQIDAKTLVPTNSRIAGDYGFAEYVNNPYAEARGYEIVLSRENNKALSGSLSYTYMDAKGLSETVNQGINFFQWGFEVAPQLFPLSWDQRHTLKANVSSILPYGVRIDLVGQLYTARPYSYYPSPDGFTPADPNLRFSPNNRRMRGVQSVDVRLEKSLELGRQGELRAEFYLDVRNLLDRRNVRWIDSSGRIGGELRDPSAYFIGRRSSVGIRFQF